MSTAKKQFLKDAKDPNTVIFPKTTIDQVLSADGTTPYTPADSGIELTQAEYNALSPAEKAKGDYYITDATTNPVVIDTALSTTSTNPVQNKVVTEAINSVNSNLEIKLECTKIGDIRYNGNRFVDITDLFNQSKLICMYGWFETGTDGINIPNIGNIDVETLDPGFPSVVIKDDIENLFSIANKYGNSRIRVFCRKNNSAIQDIYFIYVANVKKIYAQFTYTDDYEGFHIGFYK